MSGRRSGRAPVVAVALALAATLAAAAVAAVRLEPPRAPAPPPAAAEPTALPAPEPAPSRTPLLPPATLSPDGAQPRAAALAAAADATVADPALGGKLVVSVVDVGARNVLYERSGDAVLVPASTAKLVTAVAALQTLPLDRTLTTRVVAGTSPGEVVVVGGGDVTLARDAASRRHPDEARLDVLAQQTLASLGTTAVTEVVVDDGLYGGPSLGPGWSPQYVPEGDVAPVDALEVDEGRPDPRSPARSADPGLAAGRLLAQLLARGGPVPTVVRGAAPAGAKELARAESPPVRVLVERMLTISDNDLAESLARQVALAKGQPATFAGVETALAAAVMAVLQPLGISGAAVHLVDGSGLSRDDAVAPGALTRLLAGALSDPRAEQQRRFAPLLAGLPVAGFDGTLVNRFRTAPTEAGAGVVRAKTGTLKGVSSLAGLVRTRDGRLLAFAAFTDGVQPGAGAAAVSALDRFAATLAGCGCR